MEKSTKKKLLLGGLGLFIVIVIIIVFIVMSKPKLDTATKYELNDNNVSTDNASASAEPKWDTATKYALNANHVSIDNAHDAFAKPSLLVDGDIKQVGLHTIDKGTITIDLGADINIAKLVLYNRHDCCQDRIKGATVTLYNKAGLSTFTYTIPTADMIITIPIQARGSRITLQQTTGDGILNIAEAEVWTI